MRTQSSTCAAFQAILEVDNDALIFLVPNVSISGAHYRALPHHTFQAEVRPLNVQVRDFVPLGVVDGKPLLNCERWHLIRGVHMTSRDARKTLHQSPARLNIFSALP